MIPPRPYTIPSRPTAPTKVIQLNRLFESLEEAKGFILEEFKNYESARIIKSWKVDRVSVVVEIGKMKEKKK